VAKGITKMMERCRDGRKGQEEENGEAEGRTKRMKYVKAEGIIKKMKDVEAEGILRQGKM
jgi:hypothetical protein